jgi:Tfp pilus assembly protein PilF
MTALYLLLWNMKHLIFTLALFVSVTSFSQTAHETAYSFMKTGDHDNAILVLNKALQTEPDNEQLLQDIALAYFYKKDFGQARVYAKKLIDRDEVDVVSYQIAGTVFRALEEVKEADKMYKKALKRYPKSGALYNEYGELLWSQNDENAIAEWEKGIQADPSYPGNYYHASSYYFFTKDKVWSIIYGEIFVNMEYLTDRATEIKRQLLSAYKEKLFINNSEETKSSNPFASAVYGVYEKQSSLTGKGKSVEILTMIRTKFILDWYAQHGAKYPFRLFDYQQQLLRTGMFEAYNQWLFGPVENLAAFEQWTKTNAEAYKKFTNFQKNRVFKIPAGQFYAERKSS